MKEKGTETFKYEDFISYIKMAIWIKDFHRRL